MSSREHPAQGPEVEPRGRRTWPTPALFATAAVFVLGFAVAVYQVMTGRPEDFLVYRTGAQVLLDGGSLYTEVRIGSRPLEFTYPPFAAVLFVPFALLPFDLARLLWAFVTVGSFAVAAVVVGRQMPRLSLDRITWPWWALACVVFIVGLTFEPVTENFLFNQPNTLILAAVLTDAVSRNRATGFLTGVAAGFKVTPGIFIVLMLVTRRWADAARAIAGFVGTIAVASFFGLNTVWMYWTEILFDTDRVGKLKIATNASWSGIVADRAPKDSYELLWLAGAVVIMAGSLLLAAKWWRHSPLTATVITAVGALIVAPISWQHHWVWLVPLTAILIALAFAASSTGDRLLAWLCAISAGATTLLGWVHLHRLGPEDGLLRSQLYYVAVGIFALVVLAAAAYRRVWPSAEDATTGRVQRADER